jgi:hypothetical protein
MQDQHQGTSPEASDENSNLLNKVNETNVFL